LGLLTDTHCHLNLTIFQADLEETLERAWESGLERILIPGIDVATSRSALELAEKHARVFAAVGIHPHDAQTFGKETLTVLEGLARHPKAVAIGEIGLDYYRDRSPTPVQRDVFHAQLELARALELPVIVHSREAFEDVWSELKTWHDELAREKSPLEQRAGVLHSYDGSSADAQIVVENCFMIGISGPVTYKNAARQHETAAQLPLDSIIIETDAPYLPPHPYRGRRNEPAYVSQVARKISELREISIEETLQATWENAAKLFHWGANP
jgi:TatD DNase family protein